MGLEEAKQELLQLVQKHFENNPKDFASFIHFAQGTLQQQFEQSVVQNEPDALNKQEQLEEIIEELKTTLANFGESPAEAKDGYKHYPKYEDEEEATTRDNSLHLDAFLYSDEEVDGLASEGIIPRSYCVDCGSKNTKLISK
jgi:hypothetical protein